MTAWGAAKAQAHFSEVLDKAETEGPQLVERRERRFVLVTEEEFAGKRVAGGVAADLPESGAAMWAALRCPPTQGEADTDFPRGQEKPFVSAWDAMRPSFDERFDVDFPRLRGKPRMVDFE